MLYSDPQESPAFKRSVSLRTMANVSVEHRASYELNIFIVFNFTDGHLCHKFLLAVYYMPNKDVT